MSWTSEFVANVLRETWPDIENADVLNNHDVGIVIRNFLRVNPRPWVPEEGQIAIWHGPASEPLVDILAYHPDYECCTVVDPSEDDHPFIAYVSKLEYRLGAVR